MGSLCRSSHACRTARYFGSWDDVVPGAAVIAYPCEEQLSASWRDGRKLHRLDPDCQKNRLAATGGEVRHINQGGYVAMQARAATALAIFASLTFASSAFAQDLGPNVRKLADGVYVVVGNNFNSNAGIVLTQDGVVVIDTGQNAVEARKILDPVKKLTPMPVRLVIDTEPHPDHTTGHFVFSPPAVVIAAAGAGDSMRGREREDPERIQKAAAASPEMKAALEGYKFVPPHIEYQGKTTLHVGERIIELTYMKGVHSEADTAVWLPKERVLFSASAFVANQVNILRPFVT